MPGRDEGCAFCDVVAGERDAHRVHEDAATVAFLDARPLFHGHTLVVPRDHVETLMDLAPEATGPLFTAVGALARAVREACGSEGIFVAVNNRVSQSVPHLHVHVVPRTKGDGLRGFFWPRTRYESEEQAAAVAAAIRDALR